jgi:hypothetical protein
VAGVIGLAAIGYLIGDGGPDLTGLPGAATPLEGEIERGETVELGSETSEPGQAVTLTAPEGGPGAGTEIVIPGDAYEEPVRFTLSFTPITVEGYDGKITALSDLVTIENGGDYAAAPVEVRIPVTLPDDMFAMGFYLRDDGSLEPMPLVDETSTQVTLATRHFSSFFIGAIEKVLLPEEIGTGYRAGEDDFRTPNYGSQIAPRGHCAGQSIASMWYFVEQRTARGAEQLFDRFDGGDPEKTPSLWRDDRSAYRWASTVQRDINWKKLSVKMFHNLRSRTDELHWLAFRYAMLVTGAPQLVGMEESSSGSGHAMVAYAATASGLWVADPNWPGKLRQIEWQGDRFGPYLSALSADDSDSTFDRFGYYATTALVEWDKVGRRFEEAIAGTIGSDRFPSWYVAYADLTNPNDPGGQLLDETVITPNTSLVLVVNTAADAAVTVWVDGRLEDTYAANTIFTLPYKEGRSTVGLYVSAVTGQDAKGNAIYDAIDFAYMDVIVGALPTAPPYVEPTPEPTEEPVPVVTAAPPDPGSNGGVDCSREPEGTQLEKLQWSLACGGQISNR